MVTASACQHHTTIQWPPIRQCPSAGAFHFYYEDGDIGEGMKLVGYFDADTGSIITKHVGLPTSEQFEEAAMKGSEGQERQRRQQSQQTWDQRAALGLTGR